ncbi:hypothetical protein ECSTEC94C_3727 [Escherichia coli STEC_94C]|nr:hypothetical protein ECSTEC94C_3727 [Escherichia coli STEC_94C]
MNKKIWFMEGLSSQRDIIQGVKSFAQKIILPLPFLPPTVTKEMKSFPLPIIV